MAEQEVCANIVSQANEESSGRVEGESLLLPLLQELLDTPDNEQTADSGTESGEDLRGGLITEVQNVLAKLANSLKSGTTNISSERCGTLLQLISRLQSGLTLQTSNPQEKRSNGHGRFSRRKKHKRHTVGVTSEELEDARKLIEEFGLSDSITGRNAIHRQISDTAVVNKNAQAIKNATAKPYYSRSTSSTQSHSNSSPNVDTLPALVSTIDPLNNCKTPTSPITNISSPPALIASNFSNDVGYTPSELVPNLNTPASDDEDPMALKQIQTHYPENVGIYASSTNRYDTAVPLQNNPIYTKPQIMDIQSDQKSNKFASKKLKMKRANTIDIPKAADLYESEEDYDSDTSLVSKQNRRNNYLALRGPIRVGGNSNVNKGVPSFEPKTESDKKFVAFLSKHNDAGNKSSLWNQQNKNDSNEYSNWSNRFGNIRTAFEKASTSTPSTPNMFTKSARQFWTSTDTNSTFKQPAQQRYSWANANENNIVTGTLKVDTTGLNVMKNYKFVPQPLPVNKFSHAPTSAFTALPKKNSITEPQVSSHSDISAVAKSIVKSDFKSKDPASEAPLYLYSPKPIFAPNPSANSRISQNTTVSQFDSSENIHTNIKPKQLQDKAFLCFENQSYDNEKVTAPYLSKSTNTSNTVRQISNQFNKGISTVDTNTSPVIMRNTSQNPNTQRNRYSTIMENKNYQVFNNVHNDLPEYKFHKHESHPMQKNVKNFVSSTVQKLQNPSKYQEQDLPNEHLSKHSLQNILELSKPRLLEGMEHSDVISSKQNPVNRQYQTQTSQESLKEYEAAVTRIMKGPTSHQAVTMQQNSPKNRNDHDMEAAFNLKTALKKFSDNTSKPVYPISERKFSFDVVQSKSHSDLKRASSLKSPTKNHSFYVNGKPLSMESTEINDKGESVITGKFQIPVGKVSTTANLISRKADTWYQTANDQKHSTNQSPLGVIRSKSTHTLAVPTIQFQAGMSKDEVVQKKRSVEAYFCGKISPQSISKSASDESIENDDKISIKPSKSTINRKKTCEKVSIHGHSGVSRSRTLPNIVSLNLLDESNVEESFDDLYKSHAV